jgi:hypothetical protein
MTKKRWEPWDECPCQGIDPCPFGCTEWKLRKSLTIKTFNDIEDFEAWLKEFWRRYEKAEKSLDLF